MNDFNEGVYPSAADLLVICTACFIVIKLVFDKKATRCLVAVSLS